MADPLYVLVMADKNASNDCTQSTTWGWVPVKIAPAPQARSRGRAKRDHMRVLIPWPQRKAMNFTVKYRGGPECWYEITSRGVTKRYPGVVCLHDALRDFWGGSIR